MDDVDDPELMEIRREFGDLEPTIVNVDGSCKAVIVGPNEMAVTNSEDVSILVTYGLKPGHVAFLGYEHDEEIAFLGHIDPETDPETDIEKSLRGLYSELSYLKQLEGRIDTYRGYIIVGDDDDDVSKRVEEAIENIERYEHALCMKLTKQRYIDAVLIDARTGDIDWTPPEYRLSVQERPSGPCTFARIVYSPGNKPKPDDNLIL